MSDLIVQVQQGKLLGTIKEGVHGCLFKAFLGIPYATPPIGELRFKDPEPPTCWEDIRAATVEVNNNISAQICRDSDKNIIGSEDCLYLNVYVPHELQTQVPYKAVMVWIHGGDFWSGNANFSEARPDYFIKKNVILVTVNYRLGIFGFLNLGIENASGNQGLKDQVAALKWINKNIFYFGGDPNNITVFGNGAGAISAHLLMLSPLSKGLFHKVILQSGTVLCNWAIRENQKEGFLLANAMGCQSKTPEKILEYFQKLPYRVILTAESNFTGKKERIIKKVLFGPTIDKTAASPFLPTFVHELLDNDNDIPMLIGHNTAEFHNSFQDINDVISKEVFNDVQLETYVKNFMGFHNLDKVQAYINEIKQFYGYQNGLSLHKWDQHILIRCLSDLYYNIPIRNVVLNRARRKNKKTYYYVFTYHGDSTNILTYPSKVKTKTSHGDELPYMFYIPRQKKNNHVLQMTRNDYDIINMITSIWTNFAKTGNPNFNNNSAFSNWEAAMLENDLACFEINRFPTGWLDIKHLILLDNWY